MHLYPKKIMSIEEQIESYKNSSITITNEYNLKTALKTIGFYRLRGYAFQFYDNKTKTYAPGFTVDTLLKIYSFDQQLSHIIFNMLSKIEIAIRTRLCDALLSKYNDALVLYDPEAFYDKRIFWKNLASISSEIARSKDVFITHNFNNHDGHIPIWAAVEVLSLGTISKIIKNLASGAGSSYEKFSSYYTFITPKGINRRPQIKTLSSWLQTITVLRNRCAHNARLYNRTISTVPEILIRDKVPSQRYAGTYQAILAMKYLRPDDYTWNEFVDNLEQLITEYTDFIELNRLNFPADWQNHLRITEIANG